MEALCSRDLKGIQIWLRQNPNQTLDLASTLGTLAHSLRGVSTFRFPEGSIIEQTIISQTIFSLTIFGQTII